MRLPSVRVFRFLVLGIVMMLITSCSRTEVIRHYEVFMSDSMERKEDGNFETTGYSKANAITTSESRKGFLRTDVKMIEDFYDLEGHYVKTVISHTRSHMSDISVTDGGFRLKKELQEPATIFIPENEFGSFSKKELSDEENEILKDHVMMYMKMLD